MALFVSLGDEMLSVITKTLTSNIDSGKEPAEHIVGIVGGETLFVSVRLEKAIEGVAILLDASIWMALLDGLISGVVGDLCAVAIGISDLDLSAKGVVETLGEDIPGSLLGHYFLPDGIVAVVGLMTEVVFFMDASTAEVIAILMVSLQSTALLKTSIGIVAIFTVMVL